MSLELLDAVSTEFSLYYMRNTPLICVISDMNLSFFHKISFGGTSLAGLQKSHSRRNFHGCLENVLYNDISVIDRAKEKQVAIAVSRNHVLPYSYVFGLLYLAC